MARTLTPWTTRNGNWFDAVRREMDDLVTRLNAADAGSDEPASFSPRTNVAESEKQYEISLDLPGMQAEEFNIELHEGRLSISGERKREPSSADKTFHRVERYYGNFCRTFLLGQEVDDAGVEANYKEGVLTVTVPKTAKSQPRKIPVRA